ncbi:hypothetical protein MUK42_34564 [Musa troglodytarum]|uniref:Uncharacterized protein n=1 Tax=Musa troglodytarum TaxID=320322 RepID=A0A9E7JD88_9LILI|nr:hypothetical protein MUK42_34564 [Musa troglodytarum]
MTGMAVSLIALKKNSQNTRQMDQFIVDSMLMAQNANKRTSDHSSSEMKMQDSKECHLSCGRTWWGYCGTKRQDTARWHISIAEHLNI